MSEGLSQRLLGWQQKWDVGDTKWHKNAPNNLLVAHYDVVVPSGTAQTFLVPFCGKSLDVVWLYNKGHIVIGIEGIQKPVLELFAENNIAHTVEKLEQGLLYQSTDKRLKIHVGDFFTFTSDIIGKVDCVWDRGALVAAFKAERLKYVELMKSYLKPEVRYLLSTVEFDGGVYPDVSPRCIPVEEVKQIYGDNYKVELLETEQIGPNAFPHLGISPTYCVHHVMLITSVE